VHDLLDIDLLGIDEDVGVLSASGVASTFQQGWLSIILLNSQRMPYIEKVLRNGLLYNLPDGVPTLARHIVVVVSSDAC